MAKYRWDPKLQKLVPYSADEQYTSRQLARADIYMSGLRSTDGVDISSKRKRKEYMKAANVTDSSDFTPEFYDRVRRAEMDRDNKERREAVARAAYEVLERRK